MSTQPKALRLADALDAEFVQGRISNSTGREAAVELRRLHEALETKQDAWEEHVDEMVKTEHDKQIEIAQAYERGWNAALAQRQWVGLTDDEIQDLSYLSQKIDEGNSEWFDRLGFAKAIEQALKEKNA